MASCVKYDFISENLCFYWISIDAVRLERRVMVENSNCQNCKKCTDFTWIYHFLALLRMLLRAFLVELLLRYNKLSHFLAVTTFHIDRFGVSQVFRSQRCFQQH